MAGVVPPLTEPFCFMTNTRSSSLLCQVLLKVVVIFNQNTISHKPGTLSVSSPCLNFSHFDPFLAFVRPRSA